MRGRADEERHDRHPARPRCDAAPDRFDDGRIVELEERGPHALAHAALNLAGEGGVLLDALRVPAAVADEQDRLSSRTPCPVGLVAPFIVPRAPPVRCRSARACCGIPAV